MPDKNWPCRWCGCTGHDPQSVTVSGFTLTQEQINEIIQRVSSYLRDE